MLNSDLTYEVIASMALGIALLLFLVMLFIGAQFLRGFATKRLDALDLVQDEAGRLSGAKCWTHIGKAMAVYVMIKDAADGQPTLELQGVLLLVIIADELAKKGLALRFGIGKQEKGSTPVATPSVG